MFRQVLGGLAVITVTTLVATPLASADGGYDDGGDVTQTAAFACPGEGESFEGYFAKSEMLPFVQCAVPYIDAFLAAQYAVPPRPSNILVIGRDSSGPTACVEPDGTASFYDELSFEYCPMDQTVYLGEEVVWGFYEFNGDVAAMFGIVHEFAHHIQLVAGVFSLPLDQATAIANENQADCIAGAWLGYMATLGHLELPDDMRDVEGVINAVASAEGPERDHGTYEERRAAVDLGYNGGLVACNSFFPNLPVFVPAA
jgi:hypothetical protein